MGGTSGFPTDPIYGSGEAVTATLPVIDGHLAVWDGTLGKLKDGGAVPGGGGGGAPTFTQVQTALAAATGAVDFNGQALTGLVLDFATVKAALALADAAINLGGQGITGCTSVTSAAALALGTVGATSIGLGRSGIVTTITGGLTQLTGAFNLTGNGASQLSTGAGSLTADAAAALNLGTATTTAIAAGHSGITFTITGGLTQLTGAFSLTGNAASAIGSSSGAVTITSAAGLNLGTATSTAIGIGRSGITTTITGGLTVQTGAVSITGNAASQISTSSGDLSLTCPTGALNLGLTANSIAIGQTIVGIAVYGPMSFAEGIDSLVSDFAIGATAATITLGVGGTGVLIPGTITSALTQSGGIISLTGLSGSIITTSAGSMAVRSAGSLSLGTVNSTSVAVGRSGIVTTVTGGLTQLTGAFSLTGNAASAATTSSGAFSIDAAAAVNLGTSTATSIAIGKSGITATITGGLTQLTGAVSLHANAASDLTTSSGALTITGAASSTWSVTGALTLNGSTGLNVQVGGVTISAWTASTVTHTQAAQAATSQTAWTITTGAHTNQTLSTEEPAINFNASATVQFATGALALQRTMRLQGGTYGFVGASTATTIATLSIAGPTAGTNATITNGFALRIESGDVSIAASTTIRTDPATNGFLRVRGNRTAGDTTSEVLIASTNTRTAGSILAVVNNATTGLLVQYHGGVNISQIASAALASTPAHGIVFTGAAHTAQAAGLELYDLQINGARTVQFATGAITAQRSSYFQAATYGFVGASTISDCATMALSGPPTAGTNATFTRTYTFWVQSGLSQFDGNTLLGASGSSIGFFGTTPTTRAAIAALTNNITSGGSTDTLTNWTDLTIYANDAAAIRNCAYQTGLKLAALVTELRAKGFVS